MLSFAKSSHNTFVCPLMCLLFGLPILDGLKHCCFGMLQFFSVDGQYWTLRFHKGHFVCLCFVMPEFQEIHRTPTFHEDIKQYIAVLLSINSRWQKKYRHSFYPSRFYMRPFLQHISDILFVITLWPWKGISNLVWHVFILNQKLIHITKKPSEWHSRDFLSLLSLLTNLSQGHLLCFQNRGFLGVHLAVLDVLCIRPEIKQNYHE